MGSREKESLKNKQKPMTQPPPYPSQIQANGHPLPNGNKQADGHPQLTWQPPANGYPQPIWYPPANGHSQQPNFWYLPVNGYYQRQPDMQTFAGCRDWSALCRALSAGSQFRVNLEMEITEIIAGHQSRIGYIVLNENNVAVMRIKKT